MFDYFYTTPCLSGNRNDSIWEIIFKVWLLIKQGFIYKKKYIQHTKFWGRMKPQWIFFMEGRGAVILELIVPSGALGTRFNIAHDTILATIHWQARDIYQNTTFALWEPTKTLMNGMIHLQWKCRWREWEKKWIGKTSHLIALPSHI